MKKAIDKIRQDEKQRLRQDEIDAQREIEKKELQYKNSYYKNVNSIRKNIQFFFWITVLPAIIYIIIYLMENQIFV
jgi:hypothetical protein